MTGGLRYCTQTNPNPFRSKSRNRMIPLVAGACNHPNVPSIPFSFELRPNHLRRKA